MTTLCEVCRLGAREQELARIQDKQAAMKEWICEQFCAAIDAAPLGIGYQIIDGFGLVGPLTADLGGFQMKSLYFAERNRSADPPAPALHSLTLRKPTRPVRQDITPEMEAYVQSMQWRINVLRVLLYPMTLLFHIAVWLYVRYQHLRWRWSSDDVTLGGPLIEIYRQLSDLAEGSMHRDGHELTNERYRCRITVPENTEVGPQPIGTWVFHLKVGECDIQCRAMRPRDLKWSFGLHPSAELVEDAKFSVGEFQARTVVTRFEVMGRSSVHYTYYVQTARAVYLFEAEWTDELPPETRRLVEDIVRSFRQG